jgi:hypothetical protein
MSESVLMLVNSFCGSGFKRKLVFRTLDSSFLFAYCGSLLSFHASQNTKRRKKTEQICVLLLSDANCAFLYHFLS